MQVAIHTFAQDWYRQTAVVLGNGPSLLSFPATELERPYVRSLVANGGYLLFPRADVLMCTDRRWLAANPDLSGYSGPMVVVTRHEVVKVRDPRMVFLHRRFIGDARHDPFARRDTLVEGWNSTSTNISCAIIRGARRIILLGVDLAPGPAGRRRIYDESKEGGLSAAKRYKRQVEHLTMQAEWVRRKGVEVINCSPQSGLQCYPYAEWSDITARLDSDHPLGYGAVLPRRV